MGKEIAKRSPKKCAVCARNIRLVQYGDGTYRGGHYFGKVPLFTKKESKRARSFGTREWHIDGMIFHVLKKDPKPYAYAEYWECPRCYWKIN